MLLSGGNPQIAKGLRRCAGAGLHRGDAGLEARRRAAARRAHHAHRPRRAQGGEMELAASTASRTRAGSSASTASRNTSRWRSSAARRCARFRPAHRSRRKCATSTSTRTTNSTRRSSPHWVKQASQLPGDDLNAERPHEMTTIMTKSATAEEERSAKSHTGERLACPPDRREDQGARRLARRDARPRPGASSRQADPDVVEEVKWRKPSNGMLGVPVWEHDGIICTGETYKSAVKLTFAKGASLDDPQACSIPASKATRAAPSISTRATRSTNAR